MVQDIIRPAFGNRIMSSPTSLYRDDVLWKAVVIGSAGLALGLNLAGLLAGIVGIFPTLLYVPVVIGAYRYPRLGTLVGACIGGAYLAMLVAIADPPPISVLDALIRTGMVVVVGWLIGFLTLRLHEREESYLPTIRYLGGRQCPGAAGGRGADDRGGELEGRRAPRPEDGRPEGDSPLHLLEPDREAGILLPHGEDRGGVRGRRHLQAL